MGAFRLEEEGYIKGRNSPEKTNIGILVGSATEFQFGKGVKVPQEIARYILSIYFYNCGVRGVWAVASSPMDACDPLRHPSQNPLTQLLSQTTI